jgi:NADH-quinone oxidoreductase subunit C
VAEATAQTTTESPPPRAAVALLAAAVSTLAGVTRARVELNEVVAEVDRDGLFALMASLRDDPRFAFEQVMDICGVDWPDRAERFDVVYNLLSVSLNQRVRIIVTTDEAMPVPSVHQIWPVATWWEREAWDLFGIVFSGQPDLRRILTDYGFEGHPLRKDFPLTGYVEVRYDEDRKAVIYEPVKLVQDFRNFDFVSPWEAMITLPGDEKVHAERVGGLPASPAGGPASGLAANPVGNPKS